MSASVLFDHPGPKARARHRAIAAVSVIGFLVVLGYVVARFAAKGNFAAEKWLPFTSAELWINYVLPGLGNTLKAAAISMVLAGIFGVVFGLGRLSHVRAIRWASTVVVELFRSVPVLVMMLVTYTACVFYVKAIPGSLTPLIAVITGLTLYNGSVVAELIRSGVGSLPKGQTEAGLAIGLSRSQTLRIVLLPQAITAMLPALVGQLVVVLKDTAIGFVAATFSELLRGGEQAGTYYSNMVPAYLVIAVIYILLNYGVTTVAGRLEQRSRAKGRATIPAGAAGPGHVAPIDTEPIVQARHHADDELLRAKYPHHRPDHESAAAVADRHPHPSGGARSDHNDLPS